MRIATWNVNSVRQRIENLTAWLRERQPDIVCLQETKCVDEAFPGVNFQGRGQPLFANGKPSPYTETVLKFVESYRTEFLRTQAFCNKLREHDLLEPMQAEFTLGTGQKMALSGFLVVNRTKLKALSGEVLSDLAKSDALELIYLHLQSMRNFVAVKDKLVLAQGDIMSQPPAPAKGPEEVETGNPSKRRGEQAEGGEHDAP